MSVWVKVCLSETGAPVEIETEDDGTINLEDVTAHFPGATTLKYKSPEGIFRSVKCSGGVLRPPGGSWDAADLYQVVMPGRPAEKSSQQSVVDETAAAAAIINFPGLGAALAQEYGRKRMFDEVNNSGDLSHDQNSSEAKRAMKSPAVDPNKARDLIILGLSPQTTSQKIKEYFETFGDVAMVQLKKSKDSNVSYAFIRFVDKETERKVLDSTHDIDKRSVTVRIPDSQQEDKELRKVYVSYHEPDLTEEDLKKHFEQYGGVVEVFIPKPWKHYCFVTFHEAKVAQSLIGSEQYLDGKCLIIKSQTNVKKKQGQNLHPSFGQEGIGIAGLGGSMDWPPGLQDGDGLRGVSKTNLSVPPSALHPPSHSIYNQQQVSQGYSSFWGPQGSSAYGYGGMPCPPPGGGSSLAPSTRGPPPGFPLGVHAPPSRPVPPPPSNKQIQNWNKTEGDFDSWRRY